MSVLIKNATKQQIMKVLMNSTEWLPDDIEIIEIHTPHGRLIDADALPVKDLDSNGWLNAFGVAVEDLENAPTVIEAEEREADGNGNRV